MTKLTDIELLALHDHAGDVPKIDKHVQAAVDFATALRGAEADIEDARQALHEAHVLWTTACQRMVRAVGYLVAERGRGNWYYGHRGPGWGPGWESRGKVDPMRIGKARAALRREQDRARKYGDDPSLLVIVEVVETMTEVA